MPIFTLDPDAPLTILTEGLTALPDAPFVVELSSAAPNPHRFRVLAIESREEGVCAMQLRGSFDIPKEGTLQIVPERTVRLEQSTAGGFVASVEGGLASMSANTLLMAAQMALLLADLYGGGDPRPGAGIPSGAIEEARRTRDRNERYRAMLKKPPG